MGCLLSSVPVLFAAHCNNVVFATISLMGGRSAKTIQFNFMTLKPYRLYALLYGKQCCGFPYPKTSLLLTAWFYSNKTINHSYLS